MAAAIDLKELDRKIQAKLAERDASIPSEYLVRLEAEPVNLKPLPREEIPRPKSKKEPWKVEPTTVFPTDSVIDVPAKVLPLEDRAITETPTVQLLELLSTGKLSATRCLEAFLRRAVLAHQLVNCLTEVFPEFARKTAQACDEYFKKHGKPMGPLHGLPVSLKDQFDIEGLDTVMGYASGISKPTEKHAVITELLLRAGAVLYVRTNVPQSLMRGETDNHVFGRSLNPRNRSFTPGGSSGGEGALVALKGSPLGLGTDIGGSVRMPSAFNGLWGFRPSMHRVPYEGSNNSFKGQESIHSVIGPITDSIQGCVAFMRAILGGRPWEHDPIAVAMPFNESAYKLENLQLKAGSDAPVEKYVKGQTQLCFAIMWNDGLVHPHPPLIRALKTAKEKLEKAGHKVIDFKPYEPTRAAQIIGGIWTADGGVDVATESEKGGEPVMYNLCMAGVDPPKHLSTYENWQLNQQKLAWQKGFLDYFNATASQTGTGRPIDGLIMPVAPWASCPHDNNDHVGYTALLNLADRPSLTFPVTFVDPAQDGKQKLANAFDKLDREYWDRYDPQRWAGMPVNLQMVGKRLQDEEVLGLGHVLIDAGVTGPVA